MPARNEPKWRLRTLTIDEGSFVGKGDNPGAPVVFWKNRPDADDPEPDPPLEEDLVVKVEGAPDSILGKVARFFKFGGGIRTTAEILAEEKFRDEFWSLKSAFSRSINTIMDMAPSEETGELLTKTVGEFTNMMRDLSDEVTKGHPESETELLDILDQLTHAVAVTEKSAAGPARAEKFANAMERLEKFEPPETPQEDDVPAPAKTAAKALEDVIKALPEESAKIVKAAIQVGVDAAKEAKAELAKAKPPESDDAGDDDVAKAMADVPEALRKHIASIEKQAKEASDKADRLETEKKAAGYLSKAKALGIEGVDRKDLAKAFQAADEMEGGDAIERVMKALAAQAKKGRKVLLKVVGSSNSTGETEADAKVEKLVKVRREADPDLTYEQAYAKVIHENPGLYGELEGDELLEDDDFDDEDVA